MKPSYKPEVVMSIHGYFSKGEWQNILGEVIESNGLKHKPYKYGKKIFRIFPFQIRKDIDKFRDWYFEVINSPYNNLKIKEPYHRPSIIAHSLGTWIVVKAMEKYPEIKFDKLFLFGSIIPYDFDWFNLLIRDQLNKVINEKAINDPIAFWGFIFTKSFKPCAKYGILQKSSFIKEEKHTYLKHSDFQYKQHLENHISQYLFTIPHQLKPIAGSSLNSNKIKKFFKQTIAIDTKSYSNDYNNNPIELNLALSWFKIENDIWSFIQNIFNDNIIGYINAIPVCDGVYQKFCIGELSENKINQNDILILENAESFNLIVLSIALKQNMRINESTLLKGRIVELLIMSFLYKLDSLNYSKKCKKIAAFAWSQEGEQLCKGFNMKEIKIKNSKYPLFQVDLKEIKVKNLKNVNYMAKWWYTNLKK